MIATAWYARRQFGMASAVAASVALVALHPLNTAFLAGQPDEEGLGVVCALWSVLPLAAGLAKGSGPDRAHFVLAGCCGGLGLWLNPVREVTVIAGVGAAVLASAFESGGDGPARPWRLWALVGAATSLGACALQNPPGQIGWRPEFNHPALAMAWLALGFMASPCVDPTPGASRGPRTIRRLVAALLLVVVLGAWIFWVNSAAVTTDVTASRLTRLAGGIIAPNLGAWLAAEGVTARSLAVLLPAVLLGPAVAIATKDRRQRRLLGLALGPALLAGIAACVHLREWTTADAMFVALAILGMQTRSGARSGARTAAWSASLAAAGVFGAAAFIPERRVWHPDEFSPLEARALLERDLAHWLAQRRPGATALAPADLSASLGFYGGVRVVGTMDPENRAGLLGAAHIAAATSFDEAAQLIARRGITHIVLPAWDRTLDATARALTAAAPPLFLDQLREWQLPLWVRPVPYFQPDMPGVAPHAFIVLEIVPEQSPATAISRMVEYFLETGQPAFARALAPYLSRHSLDLGALVSRAEIQIEDPSAPEIESALRPIDAALASGADAGLAWDRRVDLAVVLARTGRSALADRELQRCLREIDEPRLRQLTTRELFRFQLLCRASDRRIEDESLRRLALQLLPPSLQARLK